MVRMALLEELMRAGHKSLPLLTTKVSAAQTLRSCVRPIRPPIPTLAACRALRVCDSLTLRSSFLTCRSGKAA